jgi:hypothetical protein
VYIATSFPTWRLQTDCEPFPDAVEVGRIQGGDSFSWRESPAFTASLDAAMTLVPEGAIWEVGHKFHYRNIAQRIAAVMGEVDYVQKEKKQGMNYSIVSHDAVTAKVRPLLHKHGVIYYPRGLQVQQNGNRTEAVFMVRFENIDDRTDYIDVETIGYGVDPQDKGPGKAISYGVKYALLKVLGLETGDDPDTVQDDRADHMRQPAHNRRA